MGSFRKFRKRCPETYRRTVMDGNPTAWCPNASPYKTQGFENLRCRGPESTNFSAERLRRMINWSDRRSPRRSLPLHHLRWRTSGNRFVGSYGRRLTLWFQSIRADGIFAMKCVEIIPEQKTKKVDRMTTNSWDSREKKKKMFCMTKTGFKATKSDLDESIWIRNNRTSVIRSGQLMESFEFSYDAQQGSLRIGWFLSESVKIIKETSGNWWNEVISFGD
jgi:hypothetical protein